MVMSPSRCSLGPTAVPGSYAAQVERALHDFARRIGAGGEDVSALQWVAGLIPQAQHFVLPDDGKLLDDDLDSVTGEPVHLPFPIITLSYRSGHPDDWRDDAEILDTYHPTRRFTFATETSYAALCKALGGNRMAEDHPLAQHRCIATVGFNWMHGGFWCPDPAGYAMFADTPLVEGRSVPSRLATSPRDPRHGVEHHGGKVLEGLPLDILPLAMATLAQRVGQNGVLAAQYDAIGEAITVLGLVEALSCSNVNTETTRVNPSINAKRVRRGKLPLYAFHTLVVDVPAPARPGQPGGGHHRSPRQHLRRGHVRHLASGKRTWISACVVGAATAGTVNKGYVVRARVA